MLILDVLTRGPNYGYQIAQTVLEQSQGYFDLKEGSLYPALHRMERQRLLQSYWVETDEGRRRKYYRITPAGEAVLTEKRVEWERFAAGVQGVLGGVGQVANLPRPILARGISRGLA
jgi:transcriptional regulator